MATITAKTFPGVYAQIIDRSFLPAQTSRFKPGLIGVASKGPFNTPIPIPSLSEFIRNFGNPITTTYSTTGDTSGVASGEITPVGFGYFLADAVGILADLTDSITVVRVGNQYAPMPTPAADGAAGSTVIITSGTNANFVGWMKQQGSQVYVSVSDPGKHSSVNLPVTSATVGLDGFGTLSVSTALSDTYTSANIVYSNFPNAAWNSESIIYGYGYDDITANIGKVFGDGNVIGVKGAFSFFIQSGSEVINTTDIYAITDSGSQANPTYEFRVSQVAGNTIYMVPTDNTQVGYQAVPLGDSYDSGKLWKATAKTPFLLVSAVTAGVWANGATASQGLYVAVKPGSTSGTKKLEVYWNSGLVETWDNLSANPTSPSFYTTAINGLSAYIKIDHVFAGYGTSSDLTLAFAGTHAANTVNPWDISFYGSTATSPYPAMPFGAVNAGWLYPTVNTVLDTGCQFVNGLNGENAQASDFVGAALGDDSVTGIKCFQDTDNVDVNMLAAPMDDIPISVMQELRRVAKKINAMSLADVPAGLNIWDAIDWHNGAGKFRGRGRIDDPNIAVFWNWFTITSPYNGLTKMVPPTLAALRCMAATWEREKPWFAAAGMIRGQIPEALAVEWDRISDDAKQAMYGHGNSINPIWKTNGQFLVWGDRTMQRAESKLSAIHSVNLVNWIVNGLSDLGKQFVFDPNDKELLLQIQLAFSEFLDKIQNERGLEQYKLVVDERNNTAETRNQRAVIVDLAVIPVDVMERLYLNVTVRESGAVLNSVT